MSRKARILVVDDAPSVLAAIREMLSPDYHVKTAASGEEALNLLGHFKPDLVLLDITMKGISGYEVCQQIKSEQTSGFIKIIMVSAKTALEERLKGYNVGADDYIVKPFRPEELLAKVRVFLRLKQVEDQLHTLNLTLNEQVRLRTEQLNNAEKMAAIGRSAAGIVHNLNNPLQIIMGNAELLTLRHPEDPMIMSLRKAAGQMKKIIGTILSTSYRESSTEYTRIDLNEVLVNQIELLRADPFFKHEVTTETDLRPLPPKRGIYAHFSQSFSNLIRNAVEAMHTGEVRTLSVTSALEADAICIRISDTGHGIPARYLDKIFNPFFTTKPLTATDGSPTGTGLGLASAKEMIESYGGKLRVKSVPGRGTTFTVHLPVT
ncbi:hybrid sensor histidine kinase/response regulato r [Desulfonema ishimotonii]|uniref:histidine kinase n=1 Tax=Desulfonema ishimotonii TaxID=45657 RepID=A0A401G151_9BACT|nr:hybrid sensor histidine kinase/response regulator [Desulfonema ishimotonii]GBC62927.1 hybrid sensor histidine kinase/response regulato r [Desulfonema ishimotonii]